MSQPRVIFVFGSNRAGLHAAGAARDAQRFWKAQPGVGEGPTGDAYALPTVRHGGDACSLEEIWEAAQRFIGYAAGHPEQTFYVTPVGCGIAGYTADQVAPLFRGAPNNVQLPDGWR